MNLQNSTRIMALATAGFLIAIYQFAPIPSWACTTGGGSGYTFGSQTSATSVTVCAKSVTETKSVTPAKPVAPAKPVTPVKPAAPVVPPKPSPKPVSKPAAAPAAKPVAKVPPKVVLLTPIKTGVPAILQIPRQTPKPTPKPAVKPAPVVAPKPPVRVAPVVTQKPATQPAKIISATAVSSAEASFSPAQLSVEASESAIAVGQVANFATNAGPHYKAGSLLGKTAEVFFEPIDTAWKFGDGTTLTGAVAAHGFSRSGSFVIQATVLYAVSYQIAGASIWIDSGSIAVSDSISIVVTANPSSYAPPAVEAGKVVRIVGRNCMDKPGTFGCDG